MINYSIVEDANTTSQCCQCCQLVVRVFVVVLEETISFFVCLLFVSF